MITKSLPIRANKAIAFSMAAALSCALSIPVSAATFNFSYNYADGTIISGSLGGSALGNYFTVNTLTDFSVNGLDQYSFINSIALFSVDAYLGLGSGHNGNSTPVVTIDGNYMDFLAIFNSGPYGLIFSAANATTQYVPDDFSSFFIPEMASTDTPFVPSSYHASLAGAVPEPATWAMMLVGMGSIGFAMRRRANLKVSYA
jgi:hypothetical protein